MYKKYLLIFIFCAATFLSYSQEIQARLTVVSNKIGSQVDKRIFQTLQAALSNFLNERKWTNDDFQAG